MAKPRTFTLTCGDAYPSPRTSMTKTTTADPVRPVLYAAQGDELCEVDERPAPHWAPQNELGRLRRIARELRAWMKAHGIDRVYWVMVPVGTTVLWERFGD